MLLYLYDEINIIIEGHLYWIHRTDTNSWPEIFTLLAVMMSSFVAINIIALYLAHVIWGRYVAQTTALFSSVLDKIIDLDFSDLQSPKQGHHRIVDLIERWFEKEQNVTGVEYYKLNVYQDMKVKCSSCQTMKL